MNIFQLELFDWSVTLGDVVVVVLSQPHRYHANRAELFRQHFQEQMATLPEVSCLDA